MIAFVDTETTGLDPDRHEIWEVGLIVDDDEWSWQLPVDLAKADAMALKIGRFHDRRLPSPTGPSYETHRGEWGTWQPHGKGDPDDDTQGNLKAFAEQFRDLTNGRHLAGAVVSFDEERLRRLLRRNGECPMWHYHLVDVEALAAGKLGLQPPWDSEELGRKVGVEPDRFDRHTALGDARWAKAIYEAVMGP